MLSLLALLASAATYPAPCVAPNEMCQISAVPIAKTAFIIPAGKAPTAVFADGHSLKAGRDYEIVPSHGRVAVVVKSKRPAKLFKMILGPEQDLCTQGFRLDPPLPPTMAVHTPRPKGRPDLDTPVEASSAVQVATK